MPHLQQQAHQQLLPLAATASTNGLLAVQLLSEDKTWLNTQEFLR
jgi:hypothetical protein